MHHSKIAPRIKQESANEMDNAGKKNRIKEFAPIVYLVSAACIVVWKAGSFDYADWSFDVWLGCLTLILVCVLAARDNPWWKLSWVVAALGLCLQIFALQFHLEMFGFLMLGVVGLYDSFAKLREGKRPTSLLKVSLIALITIGFIIGAISQTIGAMTVNKLRSIDPQQVQSIEFTRADRKIVVNQAATIRGLCLAFRETYPYSKRNKIQHHDPWVCQIHLADGDYKFKLTRLIQSDTLAWIETSDGRGYYNAKLRKFDRQMMPQPLWN